MVKRILLSSVYISPFITLKISPKYKRLSATTKAYRLSDRRVVTDYQPLGRTPVAPKTAYNIVPIYITTIIT